MKISQKGLDLIKKSEGLRTSVYLDSAGHLTIGYGHLLHRDESVSPLTEEQATQLLSVDVQKAEHSVSTLVKVLINQNQFDALVDFVFNLGEGALQKSTLLKLLNRGQHASVPAEILKWNKLRNPKTGQLEDSEGLTKRRQREADLWNASGS